MFSFGALHVLACDTPTSDLKALAMMFRVISDDMQSPHRHENEWFLRAFDVTTNAYITILDECVSKKVSRWIILHALQSKMTDTLQTACWKEGKRIEAVNITLDESVNTNQDILDGFYLFNIEFSIEMKSYTIRLGRK